VAHVIVPPQSALMPSIPAATAARIRLCATGAASVRRAPLGSMKCTVIVVIGENGLRSG